MATPPVTPPGHPTPRGGRPKMERRMSLRAAVNACATDEDVMNLARALWKSVFDEDGNPRLDVVDRLAKFLPYLPDTEAVDRARSLVRGNYEKAAEDALAVLVAHAETSDAEAARHVVEAIAKWTAAKKAAADTGSGTVGGTIVQIVPAGASTSVSISNTPHSDEVTK